MAPASRMMIGLPSLPPLAFLIASAALVRSEMSRRQPQHQLTLDRGPGVVVRDDGRLERSVVLDVLDNLDDGFRAQTMPDRVPPRPAFALLGVGTGASDGVASVGLNLSKRGHGLTRPTLFFAAGSRVLPDCPVP